MQRHGPEVELEGTKSGFGWRGLHESWFLVSASFVFFLFDWKS